MLGEHPERQERIAKTVYGEENQIVLKGGIVRGCSTSIKIIQPADIAPGGINMLVNSTWI